jgi:hypothetical protein
MLGIQTGWELQMMAIHGYLSAMLFDASFGTNNLHVSSLKLSHSSFSLLSIKYQNILTVTCFA